MRTLVINLTRFGDLLQTQPVVSGLKARGHEVGLVCLENFASAVGLMRDVDAVFSLPGSELLAGIDRDWRQGLGLLWNWADAELRNFLPDTVLNLTATLPGRLLTCLANGTQQAGFGLDSFGFGRNTTSWAAFLLASTRNRGCSPFNLVDQFCEVAGLGSDERRYELARPSADAGAEIGRILATAAPQGCQGFVGFQLGASAEFRRWPVRRFARLGAMLWERHRLCPVLLGTHDEEVLGERFAALKACPAVSLIGQTGLPALAAALTQVRLLVTNDTGTMHLAAGLGTPLCAVFLATAQPWDTGPYAENCLCVEPDMPCHPCGFRHKCTIDYACRSSVRAESLYHYICSFLNTGAWCAAPSLEQAGLRAWLTRRDAFGDMDLASLTGHEAEDRTAWIRMQRHHYRQFLDKLHPEPMPQPPALSSDYASVVLPVFTQAGQLLFLLGQQAKAVAAAPIPALKSKFLSNFERLTALLSDSPQFSVLGDMWREQAQETGDDLIQLSHLIEHYGGMVEAWKESLGQVAR